MFQISVVRCLPLILLQQDPCLHLQMVHLLLEPVQVLAVLVMRSVGDGSTGHVWSSNALLLTQHEQHMFVVDFLRTNKMVLLVGKLAVSKVAYFDLVQFWAKCMIQFDDFIESIPEC